MSHGSPIYNVQLKLREFFIGKTYWIKAAKARSDDPEQSQPNFPYILRSKVGSLFHMTWNAV